MSPTVIFKSIRRPVFSITSLRIVAQPVSTSSPYHSSKNRAKLRSFGRQNGTNFDEFREIHRFASKFLPGARIQGPRRLRPPPSHLQKGAGSPRSIPLQKERGILERISERKACGYTTSRAAARKCSCTLQGARSPANCAQKGSGLAVRLGRCSWIVH